MEQLGSNADCRSMRETEIGPLPAEWDVLPIAESCDAPQYGLRANAEFDPIGPRFLRITDIQGHRLDWQHVPFCRCDEEKVREYRLRAGDLLFARIGGTTGKTVLISDCPEAVFGSYLIRIRPKTVDPAFLYYFCNSEMYWRQVNANKADKLKHGVSSSLLGQIRHCSPPMSEQHAIATVLARAQAALVTQDKIIATFRELKAATMAKLFREGVRGGPLKQTEIGEIPESWEIVRLGEVARIERGRFGHRPRNDSRLYGGATPFIQTGDVARCDGRIRRYDQTLNEAGLAVSRIFPKGTIVLTIAANIAHTGLLEFASAFPDSLVGITPDKTLDAEFLEYYLRTQKGEMDRLAPKGTQKNINIQFLRPWPVPRPSLNEQQNIARHLRSLDRRMETAVAECDAFKSLFSTMLHRLMTGQVRLSGFRREPHLDSPWFKPEDVREFVGRLVRKFDPERVILFGSRAWGAPTRDSDVDLLVVMEFEGRPVDMAVRIGAECDDRFPMDLLVRRPAEVERRIAMGDPFLKQILRDGLVLHERAA